jgi:hypothetical protein
MMQVQEYDCNTMGFRIREKKPLRIRDEEIARRVRWIRFPHVMGSDSLSFKDYVINNPFKVRCGPKGV